MISIRPLKSRYNGEVGDVVVGRITDVQQKRWKVDTNSRLDSVLLLSSVNLPGGELVGKLIDILIMFNCVLFIEYGLLSFHVFGSSCRGQHLKSKFPTSLILESRVNYVVIFSET